MYINSLEELFDSLSKIGHMREEGKQKVNPDYKARIETIAVFCEINKIPYKLGSIYDGYQIKFPWCGGDVACHRGTFGVEEGKVESYHFPWDEDSVSIYSPSAMAALIINYYHLLQNMTN